jgi:uncharacterized integral membrane protein (TIGR00698 family)
VSEANVKDPRENLPLERPSLWQEMRKTEDWWAIWVGGFLLAAVTFSVLGGASAPKPVEKKSSGESTDASDAKGTVAPANSPPEKSAKSSKPTSPLKPWVGKLQAWDSNPLDAFRDLKKGTSVVVPVAAVGVGLLVLFGAASAIQGIPIQRFVTAFIPVFLLTILAFLLSEQKLIKYYNLESVLWALAVGMVISNTVGMPAFLKPAVRTEFYIKAGLVLLGAEVLFSELLALGVPGICVSWLVTPVVLIGTYVFGQRVLKMESRSLNLVISADMSVCGVSAAIATGAACRAKKEELSLAIGLSLVFTVAMMILQPLFIKWAGMDPAVGGAWLGGTIDSTGAVVAAGEFLAEPAKTVAATVKMIQNILIGVIAFAVAIYWVTYVDRQEKSVKPDWREIWYRFPKFILGFVAASAAFSVLHGTVQEGPALSSAVIDVTKTLRGWLFALAFVSIGLESNFRQLASHLKGGKPLVLYLCGQTLNLALSLFMAWLMFGVLYRDVVQKLGK